MWQVIKLLNWCPHAGGWPVDIGHDITSLSVEFCPFANQMKNVFGFLLVWYLPMHEFNLKRSTCVDFWR